MSGEGFVPASSRLAACHVMAVQDYNTKNKEDCCRETQKTVGSQVTMIPTSSSLASSSQITPPSSVDVSPHRHHYCHALILRHEQYEYSFQVPEDLHRLASEIKDRFLHVIRTSAGVSGEYGPPESLLELIVDFLDFNAKSIPYQAAAEKSSRQMLLRVLFDHLERDIFTDDIHTIASRSSDNHRIIARIVGSYYSACSSSCRPISRRRSALLSSVTYGDSKLFAVLGGQGITSEYLEELREIYTIYNSYLADYIITLGEGLKLLASNSEVRQFYPNGLDITKWLQNPEPALEAAYLASAPVSFPLIGLLQLAHYLVALKVLGQSPASFREHLSGIAGHSQGVVIAAVIAGSDSWSSFMDLSRAGVEILFWIGALSQQVCPEISLDPKVVSDSVANDEGNPSPMLNIREISEAQIQEHIDATNKYLQSDRKLSIALANGPRNFVITGPALSLYGLNVRLRQFKVSPEVDQTRIPFKERKLNITNRFLAISAPFHSKYLSQAAERLTHRLSHVVISSDRLNVPVYDTCTGEDLSSLKNENIVPRLVHMITVSRVNWEKATEFKMATHILDFGPGSSSSIGVATSHNKEGTGVRVILASTLTGTSAQVGYKSELFGRSRESVTFCDSWARRYGPRLLKTLNGQIHMDTRLSRVLHMPSIMVAGMTPTTVSWKFVAAVINAGYHIELAGGGYISPTSMTKALQNITSIIPPGRGVTINLIYANARAMAWQIPLLAKLGAEGMPIDGLTIGAGVPSIEVAQSYINDLGLKHIAFKPSSTRTIRLVINIAKSNPKFPVILQWTGGRAGGHHSFEDFHAPIILTYGQIRDCENIILVAGSGFGGPEDVYPYLTGTWSKKYGCPAMPFDGALFGSRMMTAKEADTSLEAKKAIVAANGLDDSQWEKTYKGAAGGVITVISEMGEPIHVLATRGMKFWAEMDKIFKMPKEQKLAELEKKHGYIIKKLNDDYQKVWFGKNKAGDAVQLKEMTYHEVLLRMVELMYINLEGRWIDKSLQRLTTDFILRVEERFTENVDSSLAVQDHADLEDPQRMLDSIVERYPDVRDQLITPLDVQFFLSLCLRAGQKPVPFVPVLDENLEFYFKKDSLWQSENLWAVVGKDIGRTQILQGPVAAQHTKTFGEPVKDILDGVKNDLVSLVIRDYYGGDTDKVQDQDYIGMKAVEPQFPLSNDNISIIETSDSIAYEISSSHDLPTASLWYGMIAGEEYSWRFALFTSEVIVSGTKRLENPVRRICAPSNGLRVTITDPKDRLKTSIIIEAEPDSNETGTVLKARLQNESYIAIDCIFRATPCRAPSTLKLMFSHHPEAGYAPIREILDGRLDAISDFYRNVWFGNGPLDFYAPVTQDFSGKSETITREAILDFVRAVGNNSEAYVSHPGKPLFAPLDFGIVVAWKALLKPIFLRAIGGNILNLVHQSNRLTLLSGASPLRAGDIVTTSSQIRAVFIQDSGKVVEVQAFIIRDEVPIMEVVSQFMYRGKYADFETTFERKVEKPIEVYIKSRKDVEILKSKAWFRLSSSDAVLLGKTLVFYLESRVRFRDADTFSAVLVTGTVLEKGAADTNLPVALVDYNAGASTGNPVLHYLQRHGNVVEQHVLLDKPLTIHGNAGLPLRLPKPSTAYAKASGDFNPIHVSKTFALLANLPSTIVHGMHTSSAVGSLLETWVSKGKTGVIRSFTASFVGMVLPTDQIEVELRHTAMVGGRKVIKLIAKTKDASKIVLKCEAEVEQPRSAYLFTGQGSQEQNMGMDLYASSSVARSAWERADKYYLDTYGSFSVPDENAFCQLICLIRF